MMKNKINCIIVDDESIARGIIEGHLNKIDSFKVIASCKNAMEAFEIINTKKIDLIFLDINMPGISGLSFAKSINKEIKIIFTTAYREYAVDGFDLRAVDYLLKPVSFERLHQSVEKYIDENTPATNSTLIEYPSEQSDSFFVRSNRKMVKVKITDIKYVESIGDYVTIFLNNKHVITRDTISNIDAKLPKNEFMRIHRSFIISIDKIESFTCEIIEIEGKELPISRNYKERVLKRLT